MKFRVIDGEDKTFEDIYNDFEKEYLTSRITNDDLRRKYELSKKDFLNLTRLIKSNKGLSRRPRRTKYYYSTHHGFTLAKKINGKVRYGGWIPISKKYLLQEAVQICEKLEWNSEKCKEAIKELKRCN